jgi:hypothetical protein
MRAIVHPFYQLGNCLTIGLKKRGEIEPLSEAGLQFIFEI